MFYLESHVCMSGSWSAYGRHAPGNSGSWPAGLAEPEPGSLRSQTERGLKKASAMTVKGWDWWTGSVGENAHRPVGILRGEEKMVGVVGVTWWRLSEGGIQHCSAGRSCPYSCCVSRILGTGSASAVATARQWTNTRVDQQNLGEGVPLKPANSKNTEKGKELK